MIERQALIMLCALGALVFGTFYNGYEGRQEIARQNRDNCQSAKPLLRVQTAAWKAAEIARRSGGTKGDLAAADVYRLTWRSLEMRSRRDCDQAFPSPALLDLH